MPPQLTLTDNNQLYHKWTRPIKLPIQAHCWNKSHVIEDLVTNSPPFFPWRERVQFQQYVSVFPHSLGLRSLQRNTAVVTQRHDSLLQCGMAAVGDVFVIKKAVRLTIILVCTSNETNPLDNQWAIQFLPTPHLTKPSSPNWTLRQAGSALAGIGGSTPLCWDALYTLNSDDWAQQILWENIIRENFRTDWVYTWTEKRKKYIGHCVSLITKLNKMIVH